jgi:hypothetical protein
MNEPRDTAHEPQAPAALRALQDVQAPPALRASVQQLVADAAAREAARPRWRARLGLGAAGTRLGLGAAGIGRLRLAGVGALAALAIVVLVLALSGGGAGPQPTVLQTARLALAPATLASPAESAGARGLLDASVEGVVYPYWGGTRGWPTAGARHDTLGGRAVTTVFYAAHSGARIGYAIVAGPALTVPGAGRPVVRGGRRFQVLSAGGANVVTWRERGHTCVLAARGVPARILLALVST